MLLQLENQLLARGEDGPKHDERLHDLAAFRVGLADHGALRDGWVFEQGTLDLERADPVRGRQDHVVGATREPEVAVVIDGRTIAGQVPVAPERGIGCLRRSPVAGEQGRRPEAESDVSLDPGWRRAALIVDHVHVVTGRRQPHRAQADRRARRVRDEERVLRLPVAIVDREAECLTKTLNHLRVERLARGNGMPQPLEVVSLEPVELRH